MKPWEIHPALVHFPIALLIAGFAVDAFAAWKKRESLTRTAAGLLVWGVISGWITAVFGFIAFFTAPNAEDNVLLYWHPGLAALSMVGFTFLAVARWRNRTLFARPLQEGLGFAAVLLILGASYLGGHLVYRDATGVEAVRTIPNPPSLETQAPDAEPKTPSAR